MSESNCPSPCEMPKMDLTRKRFVVMQLGYNSTNWPVAIHDSLEGAMQDVGKRAADSLLSYCDTRQNALYIVAVDR
jgi:hypothetical protein